MYERERESVKSAVRDVTLRKNDSDNEEDEDDRADREEYEEELRREMFEGSGQVPKHKRRRMWSPAHKTPRW